MTAHPLLDHPLRDIVRTRELLRFGDGLLSAGAVQPTRAASRSIRNPSYPLRHCFVEFMRR